jgi:hypothetical protein
MESSKLERELRETICWLRPLSPTEPARKDSNKEKPPTIQYYYATPSFPNYNSFNFFDPKLDRSSYSKIYANIVKFKSFLKNFY